MMALVHKLPSPPLLAGYGQINHPNPEEALWLYTYSMLASTPRRHSWCLGLGTRLGRNEPIDARREEDAYARRLDGKGDHEWRSPVRRSEAVGALRTAIDLNLL